MFVSLTFLNRVWNGKLSHMFNKRIFNSDKLQFVPRNRISLFAKTFTHSSVLADRRTDFLKNKFMFGDTASKLNFNLVTFYEKASRSFNVRLEEFVSDVPLHRT